MIADAVTAADYTVDVTVDGERCMIEVCDQGGVFVPSRAAMPNPSATSGRRLHIVAALLDHLDVVSNTAPAHCCASRTAGALDAVAAYLKRVVAIRNQLNATDVVVLTSLLAQPLPHGPDWERTAEPLTVTFLNGLAVPGPVPLPGPGIHRDVIQVTVAVPPRPHRRAGHDRGSRSAPDELRLIRITFGALPHHLGQADLDAGDDPRNRRLPHAGSPAVTLLRAARCRPAAGRGSGQTGPLRHRAW